MAPTPEQLVHHLFYEVCMLGETRRKLKERDANDQITANALMEAFCIHARNRGDTLKASTFATETYQRPEPSKIRQAIFAKINKQISHLTEARTTVAQEKIGPLEREQMYCVLFDELKQFSEHLKPELRPAWKVIFGPDG
jgi:hypothetical protein